MRKPEDKKPIRRHPPQGPGKNYQQGGHWIEKPHATEVLVCACGVRYLKVREGQDACLRCFCAHSEA